MAYQHLRLVFGKHREAFRELFLGVLARCIERRDGGISEAGHAHAADFGGLAMKVDESMARAEFLDLTGGFVISRQHVNALCRARLEVGRHLLQAARPVHQIARAEVCILFIIKELPKSPDIAMNVRKNQEFVHFRVL